MYRYIYHINIPQVYFIVRFQFLNNAIGNVQFMNNLFPDKLDSQLLLVLENIIEP